MNSLVNIAVFGIGGAILMASLLGLLLVASGRARGASSRLRMVFGTASVVLLVALPALTATNALAAGQGFWQAFAAASCVAAMIYAVNVALLPLVARQQAAVTGQPGLASIKPSVPIVAAGLLICLVLGIVGGLIGLLVT